MFRAETISESPHGTTSEKVNRNESFVNAPGFVAFLLGVGALVGFAITTTRAHPNFVPLFDTWIYSFPGAAASVVLLQCTRSKTRRSERWVWRSLAFGLASFTIGNIINGVTLSQSGELPVPSLADLAWLTFYPFAYIAVVRLLRIRFADVPRSIWLDGLAGGAGLAALTAAVAFGPIAEAATGSRLAIATNLAYPTADLFLIVLIVVAFAMDSWRPSRSLLLFGSGMLCFAVADTIYLVQIAKYTYEEASPFNSLWPLGVMLMAAAARCRPAPPKASKSEHRFSAIVVPAAFLLSSLALLFADHYFKFSGVATALAVLSILAGLVRFALTYREVQSLARSRQEARTDELTTLGNRRAFLETAHTILDERVDDQSVSLLLLDLNRFKEVNDSLGHHVGDELLRLIGDRLRTCTYETDVLARLGGDEFAILLNNADATAASSIARRIGETLTEPFDLDGLAVRVGASIGVACAPFHGRTVSELLQRADIAMYEAKRTGSDHQVYFADRDHNTRERLETIAELRTGIASGQLTVHYQPKVDATTEIVSSVEALVRWNHPARGLLAPDKFLHHAEHGGLMRQLTDAVLETVLVDLASWNVDRPDLSCAVNLSVTNLLDESFPQRVQQGLARHGVPATSLIFEITENLILSDPERARESVIALRTIGARVSLDDYGTGYSSIAYLRQLPLDELKLDRSFVIGLGNDPMALTFISTARQLASGLGLKLVAEGIETLEMWEAVKRAGCDAGQGYLFAKPMPADQLTKMLSHACLATDINTCSLCKEVQAGMPSADDLLDGHYR
jgi:diguanylate cyclase